MTAPSLRCHSGQLPSSAAQTSVSLCFIMKLQSPESYENLVQEFYQALVEEDGVKAVRVCHDISIPGKSGASHQIDVFWELTVAGITYKTIVECKCLNRKVEKKHVATLSAIINDIGAASGVIATTVGYQKGAKLLADENGIRLVLINPLLKEIHVHGKANLVDVEMHDYRYNLDSKLVKQLMRKHHVKEISIPGDGDDAEWLYYENGEKAILVKEMLRKQRATEGFNEFSLKELHLKTRIGLVPINSVSYLKKLKKVGAIDYKDLIQVNELSKAVLEDFQQNKIIYLNDDSSITIEAKT